MCPSALVPGGTSASTRTGTSAVAVRSRARPGPKVQRTSRPGATVIWTRHRRAPDLTVDIRRWFTEAGFAEVAFDFVDDSTLSVGTQRFTGDPLPFEPGVRLFEFVPEKV